ncbi:hypothetical protein OQA88_4577 [Cercophora sp. LCS_1]
MATTASRALRILTTRPLRRLPLLPNRPRIRLLTPTLLVPTRLATTTPDSQSPLPPPHQPPAPPEIFSLDLQELSPALQIKHIHALTSINSPGKWGFTIYRAAYGPGTDALWESFKTRVVEHNTRQIEQSDAPEVLPHMNYRFIDDPAVGNLELEAMKEHFRTWAEGERAFNEANKGTRHTFFIRVDEEALREGWVQVVHGWELGSGDRPQAAVKAGDWRMFEQRMVEPRLYVELGDDEWWFLWLEGWPEVRGWYEGERERTTGWRGVD